MKRYLVVPHSAQNQSFDSLLRVLQGENVHCYLFSFILKQNELICLVSGKKSKDVKKQNKDSCFKTVIPKSFNN